MKQLLTQKLHIDEKMKNLSTCMRRENKWVLLATSFHNHALLDHAEQNWIIYSGNRENKPKPTDYFSGTEVKKLNFLFASFILSPIHSFLPITPTHPYSIPAGRRQYMPQAVRSSVDADWPLVHAGQFTGQPLSNDVQQLNAARTLLSPEQRH